MEPNSSELHMEISFFAGLHADLEKMESRPNLETFRKFMEYVLSSRPTMTQVPRQSLKINYTVSMGNFEIFNFTDHQKHFCKFSIFSTQFHLTSIFLLKLEK